MARSTSATSASDVGRAVAAIRAEVTHLRASLQHIEQQLSELETAAHQQPASRRDRPERYLQVLVEVYDRGGHRGVGTGGLASIAARYGYDRRGLGGFFTGARAPLSRHDDRVRLTTYGEQLMDAYLAEAPQ